MTLTLYGLEFSPYYRSVLILAKALGINLTQKFVNLANREHYSEEFLKLNPTHTVPVLDDDGVIVPDSHAILTYLVSKYGKDDSFYPKDLGKRALVDARLHFDSSVAASVLKLIFTSHGYFGQQEHLTPWQSAKLFDAYNILNTILGRSKFVAGDSITVADISLYVTSISWNVVQPIDDAKYPNIRKWQAALEALPYFSVNVAGHKLFVDRWNAISKH